MSRPGHTSRSQLRRDLHLFDAVTVGLGAIIGAGLFVVTGIAAGVAGPAFLLGMLLAGIAASCNALSSAQLAASIPESGGTYEYGYRLLGPWAGFAAGWMFLVSKLAAAGVVALGFESAVRVFIPALPSRFPALLAIAVLTAANLTGIKKAGRLNSAVVTITLFALLVFIFGGARHFRAEHLQPFAPGGVHGILESAALLFFAFTGYARLATLGEEVHDPKRTIPHAIVLALAIASTIYLAVSLITVGAVGAPSMAASRSPIVEAAREFGSSAVSMFVMIGAATAMLGVLLSQLLGISRMMFAMARRCDLPSNLARIRESTGVPDTGIILTGVIVAIITAVGSIPVSAAAASFAILLYYAITNLAALKQPSDAQLFPPWIPRAGLLFCCILAASLKPATAFWGMAILLGGFAARWVAGKAGILHRGDEGSSHMGD